MTDSQTHYDVLGVSEEASTKEIKAAFYMKVREHPPEKDPEGHQRIREAYDVLSNPVARKEYDNMATYGAEIERLKAEAEEYLQEDPPAVQDAIRVLKKAVVLGPNIGLLRNKLGNCYLMNEAPQKALTQFEKAIDIDASNTSYRLNKGYALQQLGHPKQAEQVFRAVWAEDEGDYAAARALASALFDQGKTEAVHAVLDDAIWADGTLDFEDFFCYYDKLQYYVFEGKTEILEDELETVVGLAETPEDREFAAFMLGRAGYQLYELNVFGLAHRFIEAALNLNPQDSYLQKLSEHTEDLRGLEEQLKDIIESNRIHDFVKHIMAVFYQQAIGEVSKAEAEAQIDEIVDGLDHVMQADPAHSEIKRSLRRIKRSYPDAYQLNESLFDAVLAVPSANFRVEDCPHCGKPIRVEKGSRAAGQCTYCYGNVRATASGLEKHSGGGCFVATAVYGDFNHPDVQRLRAFRDGWLATHAPGRAFIRWYYRYGPDLARRLGRHTFISSIVRRVLSSFVSTMLRK